jgi:acylpyruvate hydrolase
MIQQQPCRPGKAKRADAFCLSVTPVAPTRRSSGIDRVGLSMRLCPLYMRLLQGADPSEGVSMKIVGFEANGGLHLGIVEGDQVIDLQAVDKSIPSDLGECLRRSNGDLSALKDAAKRAPATARRPLKGLKYALPVATPGKVICLGLNYLEHVKEGSQRDNIPKFPTIFMRGNSSLVPHGQPIIRPKASETLDYEAELIFIVGKRAKHLTLENAYSCIAGYSCGNEGSVREYQRKTTQWDMGKNFDRTGGFGPWMITADEVPAGGKGLKIQTRLNGQVMQSDNTDNMMFPIAETIAYVTQGITLEPGDVVFTGTPSGVGHARKPNPVWMKQGDTCEIDIEGVGVLSNPIENEK